MPVQRTSCSPDAGWTASATRSSADRSWAVLLVILAIAAVVRLAGVGELPLSMDELWDLEVATGRGSAHLDLPVNQVMPMPRLTRLEGAPPWTAIWGRMDRLTQPPLYFLLLRGWLEAFGESAAAARALSVAASLAAILLLYDAVRLMCRSQAVALWSAALMALATPQIGYAQLVRQYALLLFFAMAAWWAVARLGGETAAPGNDHPRWARRWPLLLLLAGSCFAMLMTHYFSLPAIAATFLYLLLANRGRRRMEAAAAVLAAGVLWLVAWGSQLIQHVQRFSGAESTTEFLRRRTTGLSRIVETLSDLGAVPLRLVVPLPQQHVPWAWLAGVGCAVLLVVAYRDRRRDLLLPALWLITIVGFLAMLDFARATVHLQVVRYALLGSPGLYVLLAAGLSPAPAPGPAPARGRARAEENVSPARVRAPGSSLQRWAAHALPGVVVLICLLNVAQPRPAELDWRALAQFLDEPARADDLVLFMRDGHADWFVGGLVMGYADASARSAVRPIALITPPLSGAFLSELRARRRAWLISFSEDPASLEPLQPHFHLVPAPIPGFPPVVIELVPR